MIIYVIMDNSLITFNLPLKISGNYWISKYNNFNDLINLINVVASEDQWLMKANKGYELYKNGVEVKELIIVSDSFYFLKNVNTGELYTIFVTDTTRDMNYYDISSVNTITIGMNSSNTICYNNTLISDQQFKIDVGNSFFVTNLDKSKSNIFVNGSIVDDITAVYSGDVIFCAGLKIVFIGRIMLVNNPVNSVSVNLSIYDKNNLYTKLPDNKLEDDDPNVVVYEKKDYFNRSPRFRGKIKTLELTIDNPPQMSQTEEQSALITIGPIITMGIMSFTTLFSGVNNIVNNHASITSIIPQLAASLTMILSAVVWPNITRKYNQRKSEKNELNRRKKYEDYIAEIRKKIFQEEANQRQIIEQNFPSIEECIQIVDNNSSRLWERKLEDNDFLSVRIGVSNVPLDIDLKYPQEGFTLEHDILSDIIKDLVIEAHIIKDAPVTLSLYTKNIVGLVGNSNLTYKFAKNILLQVLTYYSSDIFKLVILTSEEKKNNWEYFKSLNHIWNNEKSIRYFSSNSDNYIEVIKALETEYNNRTSETENNRNSNSPYYLIVCDDLEYSLNNKLIKNIMRNEQNIGFSFLLISKQVSSLPNECSTFINVNSEQCGLIETELDTDTQTSFQTDYVSEVDMKRVVKTISDIPVEVEVSSKGLPDSYGLLEMYNVGVIDGLNSLNRWETNDPTTSLEIPIGIDENGHQFKLDLHEKFHGPHGLVAGMTGSGKSEFIVTLVLSMAINYSPEEVSFVLIDYKGGGLALSFENKEKNIKLPHIAGVITNLDNNELSRALISIDAELKRRQREFNLAREVSGESSIDIYRYQKLYREKVVKNPISHLFIICDEFAELKSQHPEFMDQLVSTARIGRSLGVHLILATQKPSGVVNDQIWSNAKFKVCLKVQDKNDSQEMIKVADAAELKNTGRFYLLVGYNDYFAIGQSAYCGMPYIPSDSIYKNIDTSINAINNVGYIFKTVDESKTHNNAESEGEVLLNVVNYLDNLAKSSNLKAAPMWLDKIPNTIYLADLITKYSFKKEDFKISPIIGEYDNPAMQAQQAFIFDIFNVGHTLVVGMSGSGKEDLLYSLIFSLITNYTTNEINIYIHDCGTEILKTFAKAPQVGDIISAAEEEKTANFIKFVEEELSNRKKKLVEYGGDIALYNKNANSNEKMPYMIICINNYDEFMENYADYEERFAKMTRDCLKYGIAFIISCASITSLRGKFRNNFNNYIALQMKEAGEYASLFSSSSIVPAKMHGRGITKINEQIYEFQTASICPEETKNDYVKKVCQAVANAIPKKAKRIPILPDIIGLDDIIEGDYQLNSVPIGMEKQSLQIATFNITDVKMNIVGTEKVKNITDFIYSFIKVINCKKDVGITLFDINKLLPSNMENVEYVVDNFLEGLQKSIDNNVPKDKVFIIVGLSDLIESMQRQQTKEFTDKLVETKGIDNIHYVVFDVHTNLRKYVVEEWFTGLVNNTSGLWVGKGFAEQNYFKISTISREFATPIKNDLGYIINEGEPVLIKLIQEKMDTSNEEVLEYEQ